MKSKTPLILFIICSAVSAFLLVIIVISLLRPPVTIRITKEYSATLAEGKTTYVDDDRFYICTEEFPSPLYIPIDCAEEFLDAADRQHLTSGTKVSFRIVKTQASSMNTKGIAHGIVQLSVEDNQILTLDEYNQYHQNKEKELRSNALLFLLISVPGVILSGIFLIVFRKKKKQKDNSELLYIERLIEFENYMLREYSEQLRQYRESLDNAGLAGRVCFYWENNNQNGSFARMKFEEGYRCYAYVEISDLNNTGHGENTGSSKMLLKSAVYIITHIKESGGTLVVNKYDKAQDIKDLMNECMQNS